MIDLVVAAVAPWPDSGDAIALIRTSDGTRVLAVQVPRSGTEPVTGLPGLTGARMLSVDFVDAGNWPECRVNARHAGVRVEVTVGAAQGIALALGTGTPLRAPEEAVRARFQRARVVDQARDSGVTDERVLAAVAATDRALFVPEAVRPFAQLDRTLPIGEGQTISQPLLVAKMTELLRIAPLARVLEVGAGCGWQAAILSRLASRVFAMEIVPPLAQALAERCARLGLSNVSVREGDGWTGWADEAPFDRIVVSCAAPRVPEPLVDQLKPGGRMVIPVRRAFGGHEDLVLVTKDQEGMVKKESLMPVWFVPMTGRAQA